MRTRILIAAALSSLVVACSKTENGDLVVKRPTRVDVQTTQDTLRLPSITTRQDTVNAPVVGTKKDTVIVNKPVIIGTKKKVITVPTIKQP